MPLTVPVKIGIYVATSAASALASILLQQKKAKNPLDDSATEPSERGSLLGVLTGHYRIGPKIGYVGGRTTTSNEWATDYYESGWHLLTLGEGRSLRRIYEGGTAVWQGEITPDDYPSGSTVDAGKYGQFEIYWGEDDQPVCSELAEAIGVNSRWPNVCYIWWKWKWLGTSALWPQLEYEMTVAPRGGSIVTGDAYFEYDGAVYADIPFAVHMETVRQFSGYGTKKEYYSMRIDGESTLDALEEGMDINVKDATDDVIYRAEVTGIVPSGGYTYLYLNAAMPDSFFPTVTSRSGWFYSSEVMNTDAFLNQGGNPAMALEQYLTDASPFGAGMSASLLDDSLQTISDLCSSEEISCTVLLRSGKSWKDAMVSIMQDLGLLFVMDTATGLYGFRAMRDGVSPTEIPASVYNDDDLTESYAYSVLAADSMVFSYKDSARNFAESTIYSTNDAEARYGADPNVKTVALETITSYVPASKVAARRESELSLDGTASVMCDYQYNPEVGSAVVLEGHSTLYRVAGVSSNVDEASRTLSLIEDAYITDADYVTVSPSGLNPATRTTVSPDSFFDVLEANRYMARDSHGYFMLRVRPNQLPTSAYAYDSPDGVSYSLSGEVPYSAGGVLSEELADDTSVFLEEGPEFTLEGLDSDLWTDLTALESEWRSGGQLCVIGGEIFYLRNVSHVSGTTYRLDGLLRARLGTAAAYHEASSVVYVLPSSNLEVLSRPWMLDGATVYAKSTPFNAASAVSLWNVEETSMPYTGGGYKPLQPVNLTTEDWTGAWVSGGDAELRWDYKNATSLTGAGLGLSDEPSEPSLPEGYFRIQIKNGYSTVRTVADISQGSYTYTQAMMVADFGSEPSEFDVEVVEVLNGLTSDVEEATIARV